MQTKPKEKKGKERSSNQFAPFVCMLVTIPHDFHGHKFSLEFYWTMAHWKETRKNENFKWGKIQTNEFNRIVFETIKKIVNMEKIKTYNGILKVSSLTLLKTQII